MNRNSKKSIQQDIEHLEGMLEQLKILTNTSNHDIATADYLKKMITDWIDELKTHARI